MRKPPDRYTDLASEIHRVTCLREQPVLDAFDALEIDTPYLHEPCSTASAAGSHCDVHDPARSGWSSRV